MVCCEGDERNEEEEEKKEKEKQEEEEREKDSLSNIGVWKSVITKKKERESVLKCAGQSCVDSVVLCSSNFL